MKLTIKLFLLVALFCGTVLADGEMGGGGLAPGEMGGGGRAVTSIEKPDTKTSDRIVVLFTKYIFTIFV